ncbi:alcohol dehydrogenase [Grosmannia clavigera kw1407]|uniref:Alcohol dehydrogenase n=1 Tax=Grosmannia clavigera (strain kw1407 / UAMH 11150) TaxID=655863 RepID=F0XLM8_GROCL|nr:alcohol dehydrogenase [Grosmannia clavigera kw1407]EFX01084.1 alcohol dehydrogenase [Grosmannia clavigera kw1407]
MSMGLVGQDEDDDDVRKIVHAVALTIGELGWLGPAAAVPPIPGYEMSGTVVEAPKTSPFQPGTEVYACTSFARQGNAREFTIALTEELGQRPENLSWEEGGHGALIGSNGLAGSLPTTAPPSIPPQASSTWHQPQRSLSITGCGANATKRVLITAAAGGVGLWAVQLARLAGVGHITATCGEGNVGFVRSLGAHRVVDYAANRNNSRDKYDLVLDCVGGDVLRYAWTRARHGGIVISVAAPADQFRPESGVGMDVRSAWFNVEANSRQLQAITDLIEAEMARAAFDSAFPLAQHEEAFGNAYSGHLRGKVVLRLA